MFYLFSLFNHLLLEIILIPFVFVLRIEVYVPSVDFVFVVQRSIIASGLSTRHIVLIRAVEGSMICPTAFVGGFIFSIVSVPHICESLFVW